MDPFMENFLGFEGFGPPINRRDVPADKIEKFRGKLPDKLLEYWRVFGWCGYAKGLLWTVDPDEWDGAIEDWFGDTPFVENDAYYVIARSAFGKLVLWGTRTGQSLRVNTPHGRIYPSFDPQFKADGPDLSLQLFFSASSREIFDGTDTEDEPLFERALAKLGPLYHDTMYGFDPALALGGEPKLERLQKVDAHVHLNILSQVTELQVMADTARIASE
jgi:hypothetical protein